MKRIKAILVGAMAILFISLGFGYAIGCEKDKPGEPCNHNPVSGNTTNQAQSKAKADADARATANVKTTVNAIGQGGQGGEGGKANANATSGDSTSAANNSIKIIDKSKSLGSLPQATTYGIDNAMIPMNEYGHLITQASIRFMCIMTKENVDTIIDVMNETEGAEKWEQINEKIIPYPLAARKFKALGEKDAFYVLKKDSIMSVLSILTDENIVGLWIYNSKYNKEHPVLPPHFQVRSYLDASRLGANIVIPADQFFQGYFVPESFELSIGGLASWISKSFTSGGSVAGNAGISRAQNTEFGRPGAAFIFIHADAETLKKLDAEGLLCSAKVVAAPGEKKLACDEEKILIDIEHLKEACLHCKHDCFNNERLRKAIGVDYMDLFDCTGKKEYLSLAIEQFRKAETNFLEGYEPDGTKTFKMIGAQEVMNDVLYDWSLAIRLLEGRDKQVDFVVERKFRENGIINMPDSMHDLKR